MEFQKLTIHHYSENPAEERRITFSPMQIMAVVASTEDVMVNNRSLREVTVLFVEGNSIDVLVNYADLDKLESAIGSYCLEPM
jgi:hypothetical protein